jgi:hypothetical protein
VTGHRSARLVCALNNAIVFDVRHSPNPSPAVSAFTRINAQRPRAVPPFVVAVKRRPISADWNNENKFENQKPQSSGRDTGG